MRKRSSLAERVRALKQTTQEAGSIPAASIEKFQEGLNWE